jgi:hypothetical protein
MGQNLISQPLHRHSPVRNIRRFLTVFKEPLLSFAEGRIIVCPMPGPTELATGNARRTEGRKEARMIVESGMRAISR